MSVSPRPLLIVPALLALALPVPAAADWCDEESRWGGRDRHCEVREMTLAADRSTIAVDAAPNGGIDVEGWDRDEIALEARVAASAGSEERARELVSQVRIDTEGTIRASGPGRGGSRDWWVSYRLRVPLRSNLSLRSKNGGIGVAGVEGDIDLETTNGGVSLEGVNGDVRGRTRNGGLQVRLAGERWVGAGLDLETTNGGVTLVVPEGYSARIETGTVNGGMRFDFPVEVQGDLRRRMSFDLGDGGAPVRVVTTNGGLRLKRRDP